MPYVIRERRQTYVDFSTVPPEQMQMHARLENWALSLYERKKSNTSAGFELYVSSDARSLERREYGAATSVPVDTRDAHVIAVAIGFLPEKHRRAIDWFYAKKGKNPVGMARDLGFTRQGLADCVIEARQMLINRE